MLSDLSFIGLGLDLGPSFPGSAGSQFSAFASSLGRRFGLSELLVRDSAGLPSETLSTGAVRVLYIHGVRRIYSGLIRCAE